jgi:hypothetical protein
MLETVNDQANGLRRMFSEAPARLITIVHQSGMEEQLALYWTLCKVWSDQGHRVVVLDGSTPESNKAPGLDHVLEGDAMLHRAVLRASQNLHILASARGLTRLCERAGGSNFSLTRQLDAVISSYDIVVLMASSSHMASLLRGTESIPLVTAGHGEHEILSSYAAIKEMAGSGGLRSALLAVSESDTDTDEVSPAALRIQDCARHFLDCHVEIQVVRRHSTRAGSPMNVYQLASRTLGQAIEPAPSHRAFAEAVQ